MIAVDTNILVYASRADSPFHGKAFRELVRLAESDAQWAIPFPCLHEFLAIVTNPRIFRKPTPLAEALDQLEGWTASPNCELLGERTGYLSILRPVLSSSRCCGPQVHDARIAAICRQHGVELLWTADRDFSRFRHLKTHNSVLD